LLAPVDRGDLSPLKWESVNSTLMANGGTERHRIMSHWFYGYVIKFSFAFVLRRMSSTIHEEKPTLFRPKDLGLKLQASLFGGANSPPRNDRDPGGALEDRYLDTSRASSHL